MKILNTFLIKSIAVVMVIFTVNTVMISCTDDDDSSVIIENEAAFEYAIQEDGSTVSFTNTSVNASTYEWDFGDGITSTEKNPTHTYQTAGTYTVILYVNTLGEISKYEIEITTNADYIPPCTDETEHNADPSVGALNITFMNGEAVFEAFGGMEGGVTSNIQPDDVNASCNVYKYVKTAGAETWAGVGYAMNSAIEPINQPSKIKMSVLAETRVAEVTVRLERLPYSSTDPEATEPSVEVTVPITKVGEWEELTFDFSDHADKTFTSFIIYFDKNQEGDDAVFYFDIIQQTGSPATLVKNAAFPLTYEDSTASYLFIPFGNASSQMIANPYVEEGNTSANVGEFVKTSGAETWAGVTIYDGEVLDFSSANTAMMNVYSPKADAPVLFKIETADGSIFKEVITNTTVANQWETLVFDLEGIDTTASLTKISVFFDFGNGGDDAVYYFDDIDLAVDGVAEPSALTIFDLEDGTPDWIGFGDGNDVIVSIEDNTLASGINTSSKIGKQIKVANAPNWAGAVTGGTFNDTNIFDFSQGTTFKLKIYSPKAGMVTKLKFENASDGNIAYEADAVNTVADEWEELTFDFSGIDTSQTYNKVVIFFDFENGGDGSEYYFDDLTQQ